MLSNNVQIKICKRINLSLVLCDCEVHSCILMRTQMVMFENKGLRELLATKGRN